MGAKSTTNICRCRQEPITHPPKHTLQIEMAKPAPPEDSSGGGGRVGIPVDPDEIKAAFEFFDVNKKGKLNAQDLKQRCSIFYKTMTPKDYKLLVGESGALLPSVCARGSH